MCMDLNGLITAVFGSSESFCRLRQEMLNGKDIIVNFLQAHKVCPKRGLGACSHRKILVLCSSNSQQQAEKTQAYIHVYTIESVDSICRDDTDTPIKP